MKTNNISLQKQDRFEITSQGFLVADANLTRAGVFDYIDETGKKIRENRPPEEVFKKEALDSMKFAPLTDLHPDEMVTVDNVFRLAKGFVGENIQRKTTSKGDFAAGKVVITDKKQIDEILDKWDKGESIELSMGYDAQVVDISGVHPTEGHYDRTQQNIIYNHGSIVPRGRAGRDVKLIMDAEREASLVLDAEEVDRKKFDEMFEDQDRPKQTIIISKEAASTAAAAEKIATEFLSKDESFTKGAEETSTSFRFRVREPGQFKEGSFRTFQVPGKEGVSIVFGTFKNPKKDMEVITVKFKRKGIKAGDLHMDAIDVDISDDSVSVVEKVSGKLDEAVAIIGKKDEAIAKVEGKKDALQGELDQLKEEHAQLKADHEELSDPDSPKLQAMLKARADMEDVAKTLGIDFGEEDDKRMDSTTLRNAIIAATSADGKFDAEGKSADYIAARYDAAVEMVGRAKKEDGDVKLGSFLKDSKKEKEPKVDHAAKFKEQEAKLFESASA
jgi:hypothetical protein